MAIVGAQEGPCGDRRGDGEAPRGRRRCCLCARTGAIRRRRHERRRASTPPPPAAEDKTAKRRENVPMCVETPRACVCPWRIRFAWLSCDLCC